MTIIVFCYKFAFIHTTFLMICFINFIIFIIFYYVVCIFSQTKIMN